MPIPSLFALPSNPIAIVMVKLSNRAETKKIVAKLSVKSPPSCFVSIAQSSSTLEQRNRRGVRLEVGVQMLDGVVRGLAGGKTFEAFEILFFVPVFLSYYSVSTSHHYFVWVCCAMLERSNTGLQI